MAIDYNDRRFTQVNNEKQQALNNVNNMYNGMINNSDKYYQNQIDATKEYAETQKELQQQNTDFAIQKVEQQKEWADQDYTKEQKGAYADWQKQSNAYGVNAEAQAQAGLTGTGYAESSEVAMYTAYQNRVATAREVYNRAIVEYDNAITEAKLQNNSKLAEIAYQALQQQLELSLQGFQYKNTLLQTQLQMQNETEDRYYTRWQNVQSQINTENALAEQIRQYNASLAEQKRQFDSQQALQREQFNWQKQQAALEAQRQASIVKSSSGGSSGSGGSSSGNSSIKKSNLPKDYYFDNGYQPRYIDDTKIAESGLKVEDVFNELGTKFGSQNIWKANGKYYVWDGSIKDYVDVTTKVNNSLKKRVNYEWGIK